MQKGVRVAVGEGVDEGLGGARVWCLFLTHIRTHLTRTHQEPHTQTHPTPYPCYCNVCNTFEMVERIRTVIKIDYEVKLSSLGSKTATTTGTTISVTEPTNSSRHNSTMTRMNNGCTY
jgi:hypothetical protein